MKKKTVITNEKHEVWVVRQPSGGATADEITSSEVESAASLINLLDQGSVTEVTPEGTDEYETPPKTRTANVE